jgi:hypothetical protein
MEKGKFSTEKGLSPTERGNALNGKGEEPQTLIIQQFV